MAMQLTLKREEFLHKQAILDHTRAVLKTEFIGIDGVIDEVIDSVSHWYLFPDLQEKPVVVNLWGMTGVGKTSMIERLAELINFRQRFYHFDLGESERNDWSVRQRLEEIYEHDNGYPIILALDEFHRNYTINPQGLDQRDERSRIVWQLMDSGTFQITRYNRGIDDLYELLAELRRLVSAGIKIKRGRISNSGAMIAEKKFKDYLSFVSIEVNSFVVEDRFHSTIRDIASDQFDAPIAVTKTLARFDGQQTIDFIEGIITKALSPKTVDCTKALILVLGNLDRAYTMSSNFNPDMDADAFHEASLKITVPKIKNVLQQMFRYEQVARLGNKHIIYPAFNRDSFVKIIHLQLSRIADKLQTQLGLPMQYDDTLVNAIYKEGVYPTQGTRPVLTTIYQFVNAKLGRIVSEMVLNDLAPTRLNLFMHNEYLVVEYYNSDDLLHSFSVKQQLSLEPLRKNKRDEIQAITAVHEAGHAVLSIALLHTVPELVCSSTLEEGANGLSMINQNLDFVGRHQILLHLALMLGGRAAETMVFGEEHVTTGAVEDIRHATQFATAMLKEHGMGEVPVAFHNQSCSTLYFAYDEEDTLGKIAQSWIAKALDLAKKTLRDEDKLFLAIAGYLSDHRQLDKQGLVELIDLHSNTLDRALLNPENRDLFYRNTLKSMQKLPFMNTTTPEPSNVVNSAS